MLAAASLLLALSAAPPEAVKLYFRAPPPAERVVVGPVEITPDDLRPGVAPSDDALLRALRVEAARADADAVLVVKLGKDALGRAAVRGVLAREGKARHGVRAKNGVVLFFAGEGMPPRGERIREVEVRADELRAGDPPSRVNLIRALTAKAAALDGDALAMVEVLGEKVRRARGVVIRKVRAGPPPKAQPVVVGRGVPVDDDWYTVPPSQTPPPPLEGEAPPDPADR